MGKIGQSSCFWEFARYTSLNILGMTALSCYILADTYFVSAGAGINGLAALNLALPVFSLVNGSGLMLGIGGATGFSVFKSQGKRAEANKIFTHTVAAAAVFSLVYIIIGLLFSEKIALALGARGETLPMSRQYLLVLMLFSPFFIFNNIFVSFVRNDGSPQISMRAMICASFSNIIMDYILIFPLNMGVLGAALATGVAPAVSMMVMLPYFLKKKNTFCLTRCLPSPRALWRIFICGGPSLVTELSSGIVLIVFNNIMLRLCGSTGVACYGVVANVSLVLTAVYTGAAQGIQPLISKSYGKGDAKNMNKLLFYGIATVILISGISYGFIYFGAEFIVSVFNSEGSSALADLAVPGLRIYFTGGAFAGINIVVSSYFTSGGKPAAGNILSILRGFFVIVPAAFLLSYAFGVTGLWAAFPATELLVFLLAAAAVAASKVKTDKR